MAVENLTLSALSVARPSLSGSANLTVATAGRSTSTAGTTATAAKEQVKPASESELDPAASEPSAPASTVKLSDKALAQLRQLQATDRVVRQHEQAHLTASGGLATGAPSYTFQKGPDGVSYAVGGEVNIDVSPGATPEETIAKAITIQAAALAPSDPSSADRAVAAQAAQLEQAARTELNLKRLQDSYGQPQASNDALQQINALA